MKTKLLLVATVSIFIIHHSAFGQGALTPPGAPAPTMKTLAQIEPRTPISSVPFIITNSGSYYVTTNLTAAPGGGINGITIQADNVAIDLNGFVLTGSGSDTGIKVPSPQKNLSVRNGAVNAWGFVAVDTDLASNSQFEQLRIANSGGGLRIGAGCLATHCSVTANGNWGIEAGAGSTVKNCTAFGNFNDGIVGGRGVSVLDCTARSNLRYGIDVNDGSTVNGCTVTSNTLHGIQVARACRVTGNVATDNGVGAGNGAGILVSSSFNRIEGNVVSGNDRGLDVQAGGNFIIKNTASDNPYGSGASNYLFVAGSTFGPTNNLVGAGGVITNQNPWANFSY